MNGVDQCYRWCPTTAGEHWPLHSYHTRVQTDQSVTTTNWPIRLPQKGNWLIRLQGANWPITLLTRALQHTEVSSSQTKVWIRHNSEQVGVVNPSRETLCHTSAIVLKVITSLEGERNCLLWVLACAYQVLVNNYCRNKLWTFLFLFFSPTTILYNVTCKLVNLDCWPHHCP